MIDSCLYAIRVDNESNVDRFDNNDNMSSLELINH